MVLVLHMISNSRQSDSYVRLGVYALNKTETVSLDLCVSCLPLLLKFYADIMVKASD